MEDADGDVSMMKHRVEVAMGLPWRRAALESNHVRRQMSMRITAGGMFLELLLVHGDVVLPNS